jgi:hypothetical protein
LGRSQGEAAVQIMGNANVTFIDCFFVGLGDSSTVLAPKHASDIP